MNNETDPASLIDTIAVRWNTGLAEQAAQQIVAQFRARDGRKDEHLQQLAERMREVLRDELARSSVPIEQIRLLRISYRLEQGLCRRSVALGLAKNIRHLAERRTDTLHKARSAFLAAEGWYWVSALDSAIEWSKRGFSELKPIEQRKQGGRPYRILYATQEAQLALWLGLQGAMYEQATRLIADAIKRHEVVNDATGIAAALATLAQVHMLQGRWSESLDTARQARLAAEQPIQSVSPDSRALAGRRSASRLGDLQTADQWADKALRVSVESGDTASRIQTLMTRASLLLSTGDSKAALRTADRAVLLAKAWQFKMLWRQAILQRCWIKLALGQADPDEARETTEAFAGFATGVLEAEARYALYHCLKACGQDGQTEYQEALQQFERLKMTWHLKTAKANRLVLAEP